MNVIGPPLIKRLCGRLDIPSPNANYVYLCMPFIDAKVLLHGKIDLAHYRGPELTDPVTHELATPPCRAKPTSRRAPGW